MVFEKIIQKVSEEQRLKDIEEISSDGYPEDAMVTIGENRNQLFMRIPKLVQTRLGLKKKDKMRFQVRSVRGKTTEVTLDKVV